LPLADVSGLIAVNWVRIELMISPLLYHQTTSSHMRVMNSNWSATKQRLHSQSAAEISCHSVLSGDRIWQCRTCLGIATRTKITAPLQQADVKLEKLLDPAVNPVRSRRMPPPGLQISWPHDLDLW